MIHLLSKLSVDKQGNVYVPDILIVKLDFLSHGKLTEIDTVKVMNLQCLVGVH